VVMSGQAKAAIAKGAIIEFSSADKKEAAQIPTSAATNIGDNTLHFEDVSPWPSWITSGTKISAKGHDVLPDDVKIASLTKTSADMTNAATGGGVAENDQVLFTFTTVSDGYISCVAQASKQIISAVSDLVKAAGNYDTAAQAQTASAALNAKIDHLKAATKTKWPWPKVPVSQEFANDAAELVAFGKAMANAFSQSNISAVQKAVDSAK